MISGILMEEKFLEKWNQVRVVVGIVDNGLNGIILILVGNVWQNLGEDADGDGVVIIQSGKLDI